MFGMCNRSKTTWHISSLFPKGRVSFSPSGRRKWGFFSYFYTMIQHIRNWFESRAFGVCAWMGKKMGIKATTIRMYFIYLSFFTFGSPIIIYFILAFLLENKNYFKPRRKRPSVWDFWCITNKWITSANSPDFTFPLVFCYLLLLEG